jgi:hypothetical protein
VLLDAFGGHVVAIEDLPANILGKIHNAHVDLL